MKVVFHCVDCGNFLYYQHDGWFPLEKAKSGSLQLRIKVFLEDFVAAAMVENAAKKVEIPVNFRGKGTESAWNVWL